VNEQEFASLLTEVRANAGPDKRHLETDIEYDIAEAAALFRAQTVMNNSMNSQDISFELRQKREPFLRLSIAIVTAELERRLVKIRDNLNIYLEMK